MYVLIFPRQYQKQHIIDEGADTIDLEEADQIIQASNYLDMNLTPRMWGFLKALQLSSHLVWPTIRTGCLTAKYQTLHFMSTFVTELSYYKANCMCSLGLTKVSKKGMVQ